MRSRRREDMERALSARLTMNTLAFKPRTGAASGPMAANHTIRFAYITDPATEPRFVPGRTLRKLGFTREVLRHPDGRWFSLPELIAWHQKRMDEIAERRGLKAEGRRLRRRVPPAGDTVETICDTFLDRPWLNGEAVVQGRKQRKPLSPATVRFYRWCNRMVRDEHPELWRSPPAAVKARAAKGVIDEIEQAHGLLAARGVRTYLSRVWSDAGIADANPWARLDLPTAPGRRRAGTLGEIAALIAAADALGRPEIADAVMLGIFTGQRQADRLALSAMKIEGGRMVLRQNKKGALVSIPIAQPLLKRLQAAAERRKAMTVQWPELVIDETAQKPFKADHYRHVFAQVRAQAAKACPSVADFRDQDLRDTALSWAYDALVSRLGPDRAKEMAQGLSGHAPSSAAQVLDQHYLDVQAFKADEVVSAVALMLEQKGAKL